MLRNGRRHSLPHPVLVGLVVLMVLLCGLGRTDSPAEELSLERLKVAYVYNFCQLTSFPSVSVEDPLVIWVVYPPSSALQEAFSALDGRLAAGRTIKVVFGEQPLRVDAVFWDERPGCDEVCPNVAQLGDQVLTIGCTTAFFDHGGMIQLIEVERNLRFKVNLLALHNSSLQLSSRLLQHAVNTAESPGRE